VGADTNIYIPAVLFGGKPEKTRKLARERKNEPDNRILESAIEAKAGDIISGDEYHLQPLKNFRE
jgi:predicted nucleic acid-binding protein